MSSENCWIRGLRPLTLAHTAVCLGHWLLHGYKDKGAGSADGLGVERARSADISHSTGGLIEPYYGPLVFAPITVPSERGRRSGTGDGMRFTGWGQHFRFRLIRDLIALSGLTAPRR